MSQPTTFEAPTDRQVVGRGEPLFIVKVQTSEGVDTFYATRTRRRYADVLVLETELGGVWESHRLDAGSVAYVMNGDGLTVEIIRGQNRGGAR